MAKHKKVWTKDRNLNNFHIEVLDIRSNDYLNLDVQEVIKLIVYDSEQVKLLFNGICSNNLKNINTNGNSMQATFEICRCNICRYVTKKV